MGNDIAIEIKGVKKKYKLGQIGGGTLRGDLQSWWARVRGKEDPNLQIGMDQRMIGQTFMALNGVDLVVPKGEALGIIGRNGAGKSTLLKLISRVTAPTEGTIDIYGRVTSMLEVGTGFHPEMTGRENVYMNGAILGMTKSEIDQKMDQIIEFSEVGEFIDTPVKRYSSGMYVKLAFSVAAHLDSEIMIMDEVLAVGDMKFQNKCLNKMKDVITQQGKTILYVSHNMNTIRQLCTRCIVLDEGKIIFDGGTEKAIDIYSGANNELKKSYTFTDKQRPVFTLSENVKFIELKYLDVCKPIYRQREEMKFSLFFDVNKEDVDFSIRIIVQSLSGDNVGMAVSNNELKFKKGRHLCNLLVDIDSLAPGTYQLKLAAYTNDRYGNGVLHDVIENACTFEKKVELNYSDNMIWNSKNWGYLRMPNLKILSKE